MNVTINSKSLGITGVVLLVIGCFLPFASVPFFGSVSYVRGGTGDGLIVIGLAVLGIVFIVRERYKALWLPAIASAGLVTFTIASSVIGTGTDTNYLSLEIGPLVIYAGAALLGWAAKSAPASDSPGPSRIKLFSQGSRISSLLVVLGVALIASTPFIAVALNVASGESFGYLFIFWFYAGGLDSFAVLLAPLIGLFIFVRGYPFWSWIGPLYAVSASLSAGASFFDTFPELSILPALVGALIYGIGAIVARRRAGKNRVTEALRDDESSGETL
jgi:hypothetical protein